MSLEPYQKFAEVYDSMMGQDLFYHEYFSFIIEVARRQRVKLSSLLDLACGTGRLSLIFKDAGYNIEGLDKSEKMVSIAREKGFAVHLSDMVSFRLKGRFDVVFCTFDSLNYLLKESEIKKCFSSVYRHIPQGGLFIFDLNSEFKINLAIPSVFRNEAQFNVGSASIIWKNKCKPGKWVVDLKIIDGNKEFFERHVEKAYKLEQIKKLARLAGFSIVGVYSDFDFNKVKKNSWKWFFVCTKT